MNNSIKQIMVGILLAMLSGCSHCVYHPPASEAGRQCVVQCAGVREMCIGNENARAQNERAACEQRNRVNYQTCMKHAKTNDEANACSRAQNSCSANASTYRCEDSYRACYVNCGGTVQVVKDQ